MSWWNFLFGVCLIVIWIISGGFATDAAVMLESFANDDDRLHRAYINCIIVAVITWTLIGLAVFGVIFVIVFVTGGVAVLFGTGAGEVGVVGAEAAEVGAEGAEFAEEGSEELKELEKLKSKHRSKKSPQEIIKEASESPEERAKEEEKDLVKSQGGSWWVWGFMMLAIVLNVVTGVLAAIAANDIHQSEKFQQDSDNKKLQKAYSDCIISASISLGAAGLLIIGFIISWSLAEARKNKIKKLIKKADQKRVQDQIDRRRKLKEIHEAKLKVHAQRQQELEQIRYQAALQRAGAPPPIPLHVPTAGSADQCYLNLGVNPGTKKEDIQKVYSKLLKEYHPDICKSSCCEPNLKTIIDSKQKVISGEGTCSPIAPCH